MSIVLTIDFDAFQNTNDEQKIKEHFHFFRHEIIKT